MSTSRAARAFSAGPACTPERIPIMTATARKRPAAREAVPVLGAADLDAMNTANGVRGR